MDISINFSITTQASKESTPGTLDVTKLPYVVRFAVGKPR